jgi:hypothetical protein
MTLFAIIFAVLILSLFWGGFGYMLFYSLKLKESKEPRDEPKGAEGGG